MNCATKNWGWMESRKALIAIVSGLIFLFFINNNAKAQSAPQNPPLNGTTLTATDGGIDKSKLIIHDNLRDEGPDHITNDHFVALNVHHIHTLGGKHGKTGKGGAKPGIRSKNGRKPGGKNNSHIRRHR